jgi:hypothetical protein
MKQIITLVCIFIFAITVSSQVRTSNRNTNTKEETEKKTSTSNTSTAIPSEETSSPAKGQINTFWKQIAKMRNHTKEDNKQVVYSGGIQGAQMSLNNTKIKDPNYNTAEMEKALKECQEVYASIDNSKNDLRANRVTAVNNSQLLFGKPFVFEKATINIGGKNTDDRAFIQQKLAESDAIIKDYKSQVDAFIASNPEKAMYQNDQKAVAIKANSAEGLIKKTDDVFKNYRTQASVAAYQDLVICKAFIESVKKVFPQETTLDANLIKLNLALEKYGTRDRFMDQMMTNQKDYVKNLRIGKPVMSSPELEKIAKQAFENADMSSQKYTVTKVNIVSEWKLTKNELGIPLHKELYVNFAIKFADGKCGLANGWLNQAYEGGGVYGSPNLYNPSSIQELPCENLK